MKYKRRPWNDDGTFSAEDVRKIRAAEAAATPRGETVAGGSGGSRQAAPSLRKPGPPVSPGPIVSTDPLPGKRSVKGRRMAK